MNSHAIPTARARRGFTIIELIIVVAILGILATIALPAFRLAIWRAKQSERTALEGEYCRALKDYLRSHESVTSFSAAANPPGVPGAEKQRFDPTLAGWKDLSVSPDSYIYHQFEIHTVTSDFFVITATGDLDGDSNQSEWITSYQRTGDVWTKVGDTNNGLY